MLLRRWFARTYHQPPNSPLFEAETLGYWQSQVLADNMQEAQALRGMLEKTPAANDAASTSWRARVQARIDALGGKVGTAADDQLAQDLAASERGELPEFLKRRMQAPKSWLTDHG